MSGRLYLRFEKDAKEHLSILNALLSKDIDKAEKALLLHLDNVERETLDIIQNSTSEQERKGDLFML